MYDKDKKEIAGVVAMADNNVEEIDLKEGEEIVDIYGNKNETNCFENLGFIFWTPKFIWLISNKTF